MARVHARALQNSQHWYICSTPTHPTPSASLLRRLARVLRHRWPVCIPTCTTNASLLRRLARVLRHPVASVYSHMLTDYSSSAHAAVARHCSRLVGTRFSDLHFYFPSELATSLLLLVLLVLLRICAVSCLARTCSCKEVSGRQSCACCAMLCYIYICYAC